jgi:hypothetical protein
MMGRDKRIQHGIWLRLVGTDEPSIFLWPIFPDSIVDLQPLESGGTNVTVRLPNNPNVTVPVEATKEEIVQLIKECRDLDRTCQHNKHNV